MLSVIAAKAAKDGAKADINTFVIKLLIFSDSANCQGLILQNQQFMLPTQSAKTMIFSE